MRQCTPVELATWLQAAAPTIQVLDVREHWEYDIAHIEGSLHIPLGQLPQTLDKLTHQQELVIVCHHGIRSAQACYFLERYGFKTVNLMGGIDRWAHEIAQRMPLY